MNIAKNNILRTLGVRINQRNIIYKAGTNTDVRRRIAVSARNSGLVRHFETSMEHAFEFLALLRNFHQYTLHWFGRRLSLMKPTLQVNTSHLSGKLLKPSL